MADVFSATYRVRGRPVTWFDTLKGIDELTPEYMDPYWWAYLCPPAMRFWDTRILGYYPLINAVLFGNYNKMVREFIKIYAPEGNVVDCSTLHISSAYGHVVPMIAAHTKRYHLVDIVERQLKLARAKLDEKKLTGTLTLMNAERLTFQDGAFDRSVLFFLLHELTPEARENVLFEAIRVVRPGGKLFLAEYNEFAGEGHLLHPLHRIPGFDTVSGILEPYLPVFWKENLERNLKEAACSAGKRVELTNMKDVFAGFYRVREYAIESAT